MAAARTVYRFEGALSRKLRRRVVEQNEHSQSVRWEDTGEAEHADARVSVDWGGLLASIGGRALSSKRRRTTLAGGAIVIEAVSIRTAKYPAK